MKKSSSCMMNWDGIQVKQNINFDSNNDIFKTKAKSKFQLYFIWIESNINFLYQDVQKSRVIWTERIFFSYTKLNVENIFRNTLSNSEGLRIQNYNFLKLRSRPKYKFLLFIVCEQLCKCRISLQRLYLLLYSGLQYNR